jgi:hypothetical protein
VGLIFDTPTDGNFPIFNFSTASEVKLSGLLQLGVMSQLHGRETARNRSIVASYYLTGVSSGRQVQSASLICSWSMVDASGNTAIGAINFPQIGNSLSGSSDNDLAFAVGHASIFQTLTLTVVAVSNQAGGWMVQSHSVGGAVSGRLRL